MSNFNKLAEDTLAKFLSGCKRQSYVGTDGLTYRISSIQRRGDGTIRGGIGGYRFNGRSLSVVWVGAGQWIINADGTWRNRPPKFPGEL